MFKQVLKAQWMQTRQVVAVFVVLAFAAPLTSVYYGSGLSSSDTGRVAGWLQASESLGSAIPVIALFLGVFVGMAAWTADHAGRHVYALTMPISRAQFVLLRFAAGLVLLLPPILTLGLGATVATMAVELPVGLHAYPVQLTVRFALASLACFAIFFSISIATKRALLLTLGGVGGILLADLLLKALGNETSVAETVLQLLTRWPGPLSILVGRWALFDV
jgi:hypothetical protein